MTAGLRQAIETRDGRMLSSFYADDALVRVIDRNNPPSHPREIRGRAAVTSFWDDICSRAMTHKVNTTVTEGDRMGFTPRMRLPNEHAGVLSWPRSSSRNRLVPSGRRWVQAWDE